MNKLVVYTFARSLHKTGRFSGIWSTFITLENSALGITELILTLKILFCIFNFLNAMWNDNTVNDTANMENAKRKTFIITALIQLDNKQNVLSVS